MGRLLFLLFLCVLPAGDKLFAGPPPERPPIDWGPEHVEAMEPGRFRIRFRPETAKMLHDTSPGRRTAVLTQGNKSLDGLHAQFGISGYAPSFDFSGGAANETADGSAKADTGNADWVATYALRHQASGLDRWYDVQVSTKSDPLDVLQAYGQLPEVEWVEPVLKKIRPGESAAGIDPSAAAVQEWPEADANPSAEKSSGEGDAMTPGDPYFARQWNLQNTGQTGGLPGADIHILDAWPLTTGIPEVVVAVIDGGIHVGHNDLKGRIWPGTGYNFAEDTVAIRPDDHGTAVAGILAAATHSGDGISSIAGGWGDAPGICLMNLQVFASPPGERRQSEGFHLAPVYAADHGAAIAQHAWTYSQPEIYEAAVLDAIDYFNAHGGGEALKNGGLSVAAAGNQATYKPYYPAAYEGVLAVGATNHNDRKADYSNYGPHIDLMAPGGERTNDNEDTRLLSTSADGSYKHSYGTSFAAPHVSGVAALMASLGYGRLEAGQLTSWLKAAADDIASLNGSYRSDAFGAGRLNAHAALSLVRFGQVLVDHQGGDLRLRWEGPALESISGYRVYRDGLSLHDTPMADTIFVDKGVDPFRRYHYQVTVVGEDDTEVQPAAARPVVALPADGDDAYWWTGEQSPGWDDPRNWLHGVVPPADANVVILPDRTHYPVLVNAEKAFDQEMELQNLVLTDAGARMEIGPGVAVTVSGSMYNEAGADGLLIHAGPEGYGSLIHSTPGVEAALRYSTIDYPWAWQQPAFPLGGADLSVIEEHGGSLFAWFEPAQQWVSWGSRLWNSWIGNESEGLQPGRGYVVTFPQQTTFELKGNLKVDPQKLTIHNAAHSSDINRGYNLVANPYPSSIDWQKVSGWEGREALESDENGGYMIYIWDDQGSGNYGVYSSASLSDRGTLGAGRYIPPMQAFWVKAAEAGQSLMIKPESRVHETETTHHKQDNSDNLRITVKGPTEPFFDEVLFEFSHGKDHGGAPKMFSMEETAPSLYSEGLDGREAYSIRYLGPEPASLSLHFISGEEGEHRLDAEVIPESLKPLVLEDLKTDSTHALCAEGSYMFHSRPGDDPGRFLLHPSANVEAPEVVPDELNSLSVYGHQGDLYVQTAGMLTRLKIFNLAGQMLREINIDGKGLHRLSPRLPANIYLLKVSNTTETIGAKVVLGR